jgi:hypothetical protein
MNTMNEPSLETLVSDAKATGQDDAYARLFARLRGAELFFNAKRDDAGGVTTQLVDVGPGLKAVLFFTSKAGKGLQQPFAGIPWKDGLKMVLAGSSNGLVVQNEADDWIAIDKTKAAQLLAEIQSDAAPPAAVVRHRG